jgi:TRAP-type C4-dicarboxylate transport system permease small subunit
MLTVALKIYRLLGNAEAFLISWSIIVLAAITVGNVVSRKLFNFSWSSAEEISQFILVLVTFIGLSYGARKARHICMTALSEMLNQKWQKVFMLISTILTAAVLFYLAYYSYEYVLSTYTMQKTTPVLRIPFYLVIISVPIGLFLGGLQYVLTFIKNLTSQGVWNSFEEPTLLDSESNSC